MDQDRRDQNRRVQAPAGGEISPIAFEPLAPEGRPTKVRLRPALMVLAFLLAVAGAVLWYLLTARALVVTTEPTEARIDLGGALTFRLADHYLLRPGQYTIEAVAPGYANYSRVVTVTSADNQQVHLQLEKLPGHLQISAVATATAGADAGSDIAGNPAGADSPAAAATEPGPANATPENVDIEAEIFLDGAVVGKTPATLDNLAPGKHLMRLRAPRYFAESREIEIEGLDRTQNLTLSLKPAWGFLQLASEPSGAEVLVGNRLQGRTPLVAEVLESGEEVLVRLPGYKPWQQYHAIEAGQTQSLAPIALEPVDGTVRVNTAPAGATLTVDNQFRGQTPVTLALKPGMDHDFRFFLDGYRRASRSLSVKPGSEQDLQVDLTPELGSLRITTRPADAQLFIDGKLRGVGGDTLRLPARAHRLEVRKEGYATVSRLITPRPDLDQVLQISLLTEAQAKTASLPEQIRTTTGQTLKLFKPGQVFAMGSSRREQGRRANEVQRKVQLTRPFYLATTEVSNLAFKKFKSSHTSSHASGITLDLPNQPVVRVTWNDAARFCNWLSQQEGLDLFYNLDGGRVTGDNPAATGYRLPTEAEWAWAARVDQNGALLKYPWGGGLPPPAKAGNYADISAARIIGRTVKDYKDGFAVSAPVASFNANGKGLYDMGGNVAEWVNDFYGIEPNIAGDTPTNPLGPEAGEFHVIRDASWRHGSLTELRLSFRDYGTEARDDVGFRLARYALPPDQDPVDG